ncbi:MAG: hypothetical protein ACRD0W_00680 [Acidimicrobiales bacterium]
MATLILQDASNGLGNVAFAAAAGGGDACPSGTYVGGWALPVALIVRNGGAGAITVTVPGLPGSPVSVPAAATAVIPVAGDYKFGSLVAITYSGVTTVTVAAVKLALVSRAI